ncbi:plasmid pRiA4b ORF-3 family protein [Arthrobacter monumenti]
MSKRPKANRPNTKNKSTKSKQRRHLQAVPSARTMTISEQNTRLIDSFTPDFIRWFSEETEDPDGAMIYLRTAHSLVDICSEITNEPTAAWLPPAAVAEAVESMYSSTADEPGAAQAFLEAWDTYLHFLFDTERWTGSQEEFFETHKVLAPEAPDEGPAAMPEMDIPDLSESEEALGFSGLELIQRTSRLLEWLGSGKPVTKTGALRRQDIETAAACVGVDARVATASGGSGEAGRQGAAGADASLDDEDGPLVVRSMYEVPLLSNIWDSLQSCELITVSTTTAKPAAAAEQWLHAGAPERVAQYRQFVTEFLLDTVASDELGESFRPTVATFMMMVLTAGTMEPVEKAKLDDLIEQLEDQSLVDALPPVFAKGKLDELAELGLLTGDTHYVVAPAVAQCVAAVVDELEMLDQAYDDDDDSGMPSPQAGMPKAPAPRISYAPGTPVLQLKVSIDSSEPLVWRRILVPATLQLDELHAVLQMSFGWMDSHMHLFSEGRGFGGITYEPFHPEFMNDASIDESTICLGDLLTKTGDCITYHYDFGDDWLHTVELEQKLDEVPEDLPFCVEGGAMAPFEDSGGPQGWTDMVAAVNDPSHPEHAEYREWLRLPAGRTIDPDAFNLEFINLALAKLR